MFSKIKLLVVGLFLSLLMTGCSDVDTVKGGTLNFDSSITVGQAFDKYSYFKSTKWRDFETSNGRKIVEVEGVFTDEYPIFQQLKPQGIKELTLIVQFKINNDDTFEISAIGMGATNEKGEKNKQDLGSSQRQLNQLLQELYNDKPLS